MGGRLYVLFLVRLSCDLHLTSHIVGGRMGPIASLEILEETEGGESNLQNLLLPSQLPYIRLAVDKACVRLGPKCEVVKFKIGISRYVSRFLGRAREVSFEKLDYFLFLSSSSYFLSRTQNSG
jgi:hypothetical protein